MELFVDFEDELGLGQLDYLLLNAEVWGWGRRATDHGDILDLVGDVVYAVEAVVEAEGLAQAA